MAIFLWAIYHLIKAESQASSENTHAQDRAIFLLFMSHVIFPIYSIIWAKIWKKNCHFVQNLAQNWADWYMNGLLFLEKLVFVWVYFQIPWRHIPTKTKLEYPPGFGHRINEEVVTRYFHKNIINHKFVQYILQVSSGNLKPMLK